MKKCSRLRKEAWDAVVRTKWLWRLAAAIVLLNAIIQSVMLAVAGSYAKMGIATWSEFASAKISAARQGLTYAVPSFSAALQMTGASLFETFIAYIFGSIFTLGIAAISLKALRDDRRKWLAGSLEGFRRPLEAAWLMFLINFKVFLWSLLLIVPGIVAAYRYRQAWYVKAQHPDWSAAECIAQSSRLMDGCKWKAFVFDLSYIPWLLLAGVCAGMSILLGSAFAGALFMGAVLFVLCYFFAGRAAFYRNLVEERKAAQ